MDTITHPHRRKKSIQTTETLSQALPSLSTPKANVLRGELGEARSQIMLMQAKLRKLRQMKDKHELVNQRNLTRIDFMNGVKQRVFSEYEQKQKIRAQRAESLEALKYETGAKRQAMLAQKKRAEEQLMASKANDAEEERRRHKQHEYLIKRLKQMETIEKEKKVQRVKELHETSASRLKEFKDSRIAFSKDNYHKKVAQTLEKKQKARDILEQLRLQEQRLMADVKHSEQAMMKSVYTLQTINPQRTRKIRSQRAREQNSLSHFSLEP